MFVDHALKVQTDSGIPLVVLSVGLYFFRPCFFGAFSTFAFDRGTYTCCSCIPLSTELCKGCFDFIFVLQRS